MHRALPPLAKLDGLPARQQGVQQFDIAGMKVRCEGLQQDSVEPLGKGVASRLAWPYASRLNPQSASAISNYHRETSPSRRMALRKPEAVSLSQGAEATLITC